MTKTIIILVLCYFAMGCTMHTCKWGPGTIGHMIECEEQATIEPCYGKCDDLMIVDAE